MGEMIRCKPHSWICWCVVGIQEAHVTHVREPVTWGHGLRLYGASSRITWNSRKPQVSKKSLWTKRCQKLQVDHQLIKCLVLGLPNATSSQLNLSRLFSSHPRWWLLPRTVPCLVGCDGPAHWKELTDPSKVPRKSLAVWMAFRELRFIMKRIWASRIFNLTSYDHSSSLCYALHWSEQQHWEAALPYQVLVLGTATVCFLCEVIRFLLSQYLPFESAETDLTFCFWCVHPEDQQKISSILCSSVYLRQGHASYRLEHHQDLGKIWTQA